MSTLLKKKYLHQGRLSLMEGVGAAVEDEAAIVSSSCSRKRKLDAVTSVATVSTTTTTAAPKKGVSFMDLVTFIIPPCSKKQQADGMPYHPPLDADMLQLYRQDIWYSRHEYRTFWKDRMDSVRLYRSVNGDMDACGPELLSQYTIRGLESYVLFSGSELARQRDKYTHTVLSQQDCHRIRPIVEAWSAIALERAQSWAAQDAHEAASVHAAAATGAGATSCCHETDIMTESLHTGSRSHNDTSAAIATATAKDDSSVQSLSPPCSPNSVILDTAVLPSCGDDCQSNNPILDIKTMNQRLIQQMHSEQRQQQQQQQGSNKKPQRRTTMPHMPSTASISSLPSNLSPMEQRRFIIIEQRRNSMQLARLQQQQLQLEQEKQQQEQLEHKRRRYSMSAILHHSSQSNQFCNQSNTKHDDYDRHMKFCNDLLSSHHQFAAGSGGSSRHDSHQFNGDNDVMFMGSRSNNNNYCRSNSHRNSQLCGPRHRDSLALGMAHHYHGHHGQSHGGDDTLDVLQDEYLHQQQQQQQTQGGLVQNRHGQHHHHRASRRNSLSPPPAVPTIWEGDEQRHSLYMQQQYRHHRDSMSMLAAAGSPPQRSQSPPTSSGVSAVTRVPSPEQSQHRHGQCQPQQQHPQPQQRRQSQAMYTDSVTSLSRLRRDSLVGGHL